MPKPTEEQIRKVLDRLADARCAGARSRYSAMTYEQGVEFTLEWVLGETDPADGEDWPFADD